MVHNAPSKPAQNSIMADAILCRATGRAYLEAPMAYRSGCDIKNADEAKVPSGAKYVLYGVTEDRSARIVFLDADAAFAWLGENIGATITVLIVGRLH